MGFCPQIQARLYQTKFELTITQLINDQDELAIAISPQRQLPNHHFQMSLYSKAILVHGWHCLDLQFSCHWEGRGLAFKKFEIKNS